MAIDRDLADVEMRAFERDAKIGLLATVDPEGRPHLTLITSIQARGPRELMFGQFTEGLSKAHLRRDPRAAFLVMTPERRIWRGRARWTHEARSGEDYERYNRKPMFRYNAYFGIHTVHYLELVDVTGPERVSAARLAAGTAALALVRPAGARDHVPALRPWAERHLARVTTLKFLAWIGADGHPTITPPIACRAVDAGRLAFRPLAAGDGAAPAAGQDVAVFALNLAMESVLVRGRFDGWRRHAGVAAGGIEIDWVYNSMPPKQGQIHPPVPLTPVTAFRRPPRACA